MSVKPRNWAWRQAKDCSHYQEKSENEMCNNSFVIGGCVEEESVSAKREEHILDYNESIQNEQDFPIGEYILTLDQKRRITLPDSLFGDISDDEELVVIGRFGHCEIWR